MKLEDYKKGRRRQKDKKDIYRKEQGGSCENRPNLRWATKLQLSEITAIFLFFFPCGSSNSDLFLLLIHTSTSQTVIKKKRNVVPEINSHLNRIQLAVSVGKPRKYIWFNCPLLVGKDTPNIQQSLLFMMEEKKLYPKLVKSN